MFGFGYEAGGAALLPRARLYLARGEVVLARTLLEQALHDIQTPTLHQMPLLLLLVDVTLAMGDLPAARMATQALAGLAQQTHSNFLLAQAEMARGKVKQASGEPDALETYRAALERLRAHEQSLQAARIRLEMANTLRHSDQPGAIIWARAAHSSFVRLGAARDADEARKLLHEMGVAIRTASPALDVLSKREREILELIAHGLTNRDIAKRLFLSEKTVEHHVGHILSKLQVRTRAEAVAYLSNSSSH
ncbi:MAG: LuxR C-terminal-related transcriptional regulator [Chloroflexi bacterium]|nr:LuxR C-terminal-related transcriptional regulator [Chloroflexota bacterium]